MGSMPSRTASAFPPASTDLAERLRLIELETTPEQRLRSAAINQLVREQTAGKCDREYREPVLSSRGTPARYFGATLSCVRGAK